MDRLLLPAILHDRPDAESVGDVPDRGESIRDIGYVRDIAQQDARAPYSRPGTGLKVASERPVGQTTPAATLESEETRVRRLAG